MNNNQWYKKEAPLQGLTGLWGGLASNLTGGGGLLVGQQAYTYSFALCKSYSETAFLSIKLCCDSLI